MDYITPVGHTRHWVIPRGAIYILLLPLLVQPGAVISQPDSHHSVVRFQDGQEERVANKELVIAEGSVSCPPLHIGDYVLARVRARKLAESDVYMPGVVSVLPENPRAALGFHSVTAVGGRNLVCSRRALVKISRVRYQRMCAHLTSLLATRRRNIPSPASSRADNDHSTCSGGGNEWPPEGRCGQDTLPSSPASHTPTLSPPPSPPPEPLLIDRGTSPEPLMVDAVTSTDPQMESVAILTDPMVQDVAVETVQQVCLSVCLSVCLVMGGKVVGPK